MRCGIGCCAAISGGLAVLLAGCVQHTRGVCTIPASSAESCVWCFELAQDHVRVQTSVLPVDTVILDAGGTAVSELILRPEQSFTIQRQVRGANWTEHWRLLDCSEHEAVFATRGSIPGFWARGIPAKLEEWTVLVRPEQHAPGRVLWREDR
jgi:hypothetical protein